MKSIFWRLRNISFFLRAYLYVLLHGRPNRKLSGEPKKIVIIQGARMGDMVCTTPVFRAIKERYPESRLVVVGDNVNEQLMAGHPYVNRYIVWKNNFGEALRALREERADFGAICLPSLEGLALLILGTVGFIAAPKINGGQSPYETSTYKSLLRAVYKIPHYFDHYVPREYLRLLEPIGIASDNTKKHLTFSEKARASVNKIIEENCVELEKKLIGILPGVGGDPLKLWEPEKFAKVADYLWQKHHALPIILGSGIDALAVGKTLATISPETRVINLFNRLSIEELKALIFRLSLFVSADTGPIYIAEAFDIPTIDILGPVKENVQPPCGLRQRVIFAPREKGMLGVLDNITRDIKEARRQSEAITVEMVTTVIDELIPTQ